MSIQLPTHGILLKGGIEWKKWFSKDFFLVLWLRDATCKTTDLMGMVNYGSVERSKQIVSTIRKIYLIKEDGAYF